MEITLQKICTIWGEFEFSAQNHFEEQIISYKKTDYNETQTRRDFIDPFFKALGRNVNNLHSLLL